MLTGTLTVFASGNKAEIRGMDKADGKHIADTIRERLTSTMAHSPAREETRAARQPDIYQQLAKLGQLRDAGILTTEEFDAKKAELLSRL